MTVYISDEEFFLNIAFMLKFYFCAMDTTEKVFVFFLFICT